MLAFLLSEVPRLATKVGWLERRGRTAEVIRKRSSDSKRWQSHRMISELTARRLSDRDLLRVRQGRRRHYQSVVEAYALYKRMLSAVDQSFICYVVEHRAIVVAGEAQLFELVVLFSVLDTLARDGWQHSPLQLIEGKLQLAARRADSRLRLFFQTLPDELSAVSEYVAGQQRHGLRPSRLRPDITIEVSSPRGCSWLLVEVKGGPKRSAEASVRESLSDLLAYGRDYAAALSTQDVPYGLGVAWGGDLSPDFSGPVGLCTQDNVAEAIRHLLLTYQRVL
jgi:hypothetical protein